MDHFSNQRHCCSNRCQGSPSCGCDDGCGMPPQSIMPAKPCPQVSAQRPVRPMPCPAPIQPNCGCASNIAPAKPCCGGGVSNAVPMPAPRPSCGCASNAEPMPRQGCGCGMSKSNPACTNNVVNNDPMACLVPGMCYVPWQRWPECPYEFCRAFQTGTIFPDLDKPFLIGRCARL